MSDGTEQRFYRALEAERDQLRTDLAAALKREGEARAALENQVHAHRGTIELMDQARAERAAALKREAELQAALLDRHNLLADTVNQRDTALKREGEARELAKERHDAANLLFEAAREARERAIEECARVVDAIYCDEKKACADLTCPMLVAAAMDIRALAPVPTAEADKETT